MGLNTISFEAHRYTCRPLYYLIVCCFLNIILDLVLVIVFDMGIVGAAIATIISQAVSAILVTNALMKKYDDCKLYLSKLHIDLLKLRMEFRIGIPSALQAFMYSITNIIIQAAINGFGTDTAAAWASFGKLDALFWTVNGAFGIAITTFAGQKCTYLPCHGCGCVRRDRAVFSHLLPPTVLNFYDRSKCNQYRY